MSVGFGSGVSMSNKSSKNECYRFDMPISGEGTYTQGTKEFQMIVPQDVIKNELGGGLGTAVKALQMIGGGFSKTQYYLEAVLDVPGGFDVNKKVQITINKAPVQTSGQI